MLEAALVYLALLGASLSSIPFIHEVYLAVKSFVHTCPSEVSPPSYGLDVFCITQGCLT